MLPANLNDLHNIVLLAPLGICILDADTLIAEIVNDKYLDVTGKKREEVVGVPHWDTFAEARAHYEPVLSTVIQTGKPYYASEAEVMLVRHGKQDRIFVTFVYSPIADDSGRVKKVTVWVLENTKQVAERRAIEAAKVALQRERDRLKHLFMQAPAGICILDGPELIFELVNPAYQAILPGRKLMGRPIFEALPELVGTPIQEVLLNVYRTGQPYITTQLLIPVADYEGGPTQDRYFTFTYQARLNEREEVDGLLAFGFEVTEMIKVQHDLQEARERAEQQKRVYETITSGTPDLMYVFGMDYRFTYANSALLTMWGKTWETAIGRNLLENGYEPWHAEMHEREIDEIKRTKQPIRGEVSFPHAVLGRRVYDYILTPVLNEAGEVEAVAGITRDITERSQWETSLTNTSIELQSVNEQMAAANEELTLSNEQLGILNEQLLEAQRKVEESETSLRLAIEAANLGTWVMSEQLDRIIGSSRFYELFGYRDSEEVYFEAALEQVAPDYRSLVWGVVQRSFKTGETLNLEFPITRKDGEQRWLRAFGKHVVDRESGNYLTGVMADITEQKADDIRKNDFIGMVSHELKTPLTSLSGIIQVANAKLKNSDDNFLANAMGKAAKQVKKMTNMINGFLNISRLESGKILINRQDFNLEQLLIETIEDAKISSPNNHIKLEACDDIILNADRDKIGSVISNLISNAIKYSPAGKEIVVKCEKHQNNVIVAVKDEGIGIAPEDLNKIFDRYYRVETNYTRHISGFGIGLYLSSEIIQRHGGRVWAESEVGKGATFYFELPI